MIELGPLFPDLSETAPKAAQMVLEVPVPWMNDELSSLVGSRVVKLCSEASAIPEQRQGHSVDAVQALIWRWRSRTWAQAL